MDETTLKAIEARANAADLGPWRAEPYEDPLGSGRVDPMRCDGITGADGFPVVKTDSGVYPPEMPTAEFIAHAREDVPALVAEVRRLREALASIRDIEIYVAGRPCSCAGVGCVECVARSALDGGELHS